MLYRVESIRSYEMTRDIKLKNCTTGTIDICFDDSDVASCDKMNITCLKNRIWMKT